MHLILKAANPALRLTIEIKGFSGVRTEEIVRLWWIMIDEKDKCIRVPNAVGKIDAWLVLILPSFPRLGRMRTSHASILPTALGTRMHLSFSSIMIHQRRTISSVRTPEKPLISIVRRSAGLADLR